MTAVLEKGKGKVAIVAVSTNAEAPRDVRETIRSTILSLRSEYNENGPVVLCSFATSRRVDERGGKSFNARANEVMSIV